MKVGKYIIGYCRRSEDVESGYLYCFDPIAEDDLWELFLPRITIQWFRLYRR